MLAPLTTSSFPHGYLCWVAWILMLCCNHCVFLFLSQIHEFTYREDLPPHGHQTHLCSGQVRVWLTSSQLWIALIHWGPQKSWVLTEKLMLVTPRSILCVTVDNSCVQGWLDSETMHSFEEGVDLHISATLIGWTGWVVNLGLIK